MTTALFQKTTLTFHEGETWRIDFSCHDSDDSVMPLPVGTTAQFRLADNSGANPVDIFTRSTADDVTITDALNGLGNIIIQPAIQAMYNINASGTYVWEFRVITLAFTSIQGAGPFKVLPSLFSLSGP